MRNNLFIDAGAWLFAVILFFGVWLEVAGNTGTWGVTLGWLPAGIVAYLWIRTTVKFIARHYHNSRQPGRFFIGAN